MMSTDLLRGLEALKQFEIDFSEWSEQKKAIETPSKSSREPAGAEEALEG
jgi:hypothetical protein